MGTSWNHKAVTRHHYPVSICTVSSKSKTSKPDNSRPDELYLTPSTIVTVMN